MTAIKKVKIKMVGGAFQCQRHLQRMTIWYNLVMSSVVQRQCLRGQCRKIMDGGTLQILFRRLPQTRFESFRVGQFLLHSIGVPAQQIRHRTPDFDPPKQGRMMCCGEQRHVAAAGTAQEKNFGFINGILTGNCVNCFDDIGDGQIRT